MEKTIYQNCHLKIPTYTFHKLALAILEQQKSEFIIAEENLLEKTITNFFKYRFLENKNTKKAMYRICHIYGPFKQKRYLNKNTKEQEKLLKTFLNLFKVNNYNKKDWLAFFKEKKAKNWLILLYAIHILYENEKKQTNSIDFEDMITLATDVVKNSKNFLPYKLIIIDEFQDASQNRLKLIQEIIKKTNASLCACGDDYQSIYHFQGSDISLFLNFKNIFKGAKYYKLQTTYRTSNELIKTAGNFILKNKNQIKKELHSNKSIPKPIKIVYAKNKKQTFQKIINHLPKDASIFILGRNNFDLKYYNNDYYRKNQNIRFLTIHASKGLEADYVIILNMINDIYGFPSKQKNHYILNLVNQKLNFPYEEERRLFYVALTRAKKEVYLLTNKNNPSLFIKEIKKEKEVEIINYHHLK